MYWYIFSGLVGSVFFGFLASASTVSLTEAEYRKFFADRAGCFLMTDIKTGAVVTEFNPSRCKERFSPCSSFKIAAALMAFENGILKNEGQIIPWDGAKRERPELNMDQTPLTWMGNSALWVTSWLVPQLGVATITDFLKKFEYGNADFSGPREEPWQTSSLKISAMEQVRFVSRLWKDELPVTKRSSDLTKKIIFIKKMAGDSELFGKTGTGCLVGTKCMDKPDRMIGWFVGVLRTKKGDYAFAANASDLVAQKAAAGPRMRETVIKIFERILK